MPKKSNDSLRKINAVLHRDLGYFFAALLIAYSLSGIALNHIDEWNPDFIVKKTSLDFDGSYDRQNVDAELIRHFSRIAGEDTFRLYDFPSERQVKVYYKDATLLVNLADGSGTYEKISRRPLFYQFNVLHRNSVDWWKWASDIFAVMLIIITVTGVIMLRGKNGFSGRGKWLAAAGLIPPLAALILQNFQ
ncbi:MULTISPECIES: PepSY-associated TM helix domain-containing protein [Prosthecochloris]|uniref:PepSY-associated TM helix domain-containing protein n=1 Tax=Prosthecochloris TaxID=1101 RepID=UPI00080A96BC|nr:MULTISPECIES: PepSY-associated TM helix domain-containing protein [Prosthecochloris]ANT65510.1 putative iron-regulated membrane protein [Prosthecochloris sp. CIB 2401]